MALVTNLILFDDVERRAFIRCFLGEITAEEIENIEVQENPNCCEELLVVRIAFHEVNTFVTADHTRENGFKVRLRGETNDETYKESR